MGGSYPAAVETCTTHGLPGTRSRNGKPWPNNLNKKCGIASNDAEPLRWAVVARGPMQLGRWFGSALARREVTSSRWSRRLHQESVNFMTALHPGPITRLRRRRAAALQRRWFVQCLLQSWNEIGEAERVLNHGSVLDLQRAGRVDRWVMMLSSPTSLSKRRETRYA